MNKWRILGDRTALWITALFAGGGMLAALWFLSINQALVYDLALLTLIGLPVISYFSAKKSGFAPALILYVFSQAIFLIYCSTKRGRIVSQSQG